MRAAVTDTRRIWAAHVQFEVCVGIKRLILLGEAPTSFRTSGSTLRSALISGTRLQLIIVEGHLTCIRLSDCTNIWGRPHISSTMATTAHNLLDSDACNSCCVHSPIFRSLNRDVGIVGSRPGGENTHLDIC